jgi:hypothetical protein
MGRSEEDSTFISRRGQDKDEDEDGGTCRRGQDNSVEITEDPQTYWDSEV